MCSGTPSGTDVSCGHVRLASRLRLPFAWVSRLRLPLGRSGTIVVMWKRGKLPEHRHGNRERPERSETAVLLLDFARQYVLSAKLTYRAAHTHADAAPQVTARVGPCHVLFLEMCEGAGHLLTVLWVSRRGLRGWHSVIEAHQVSGNEGVRDGSVGVFSSKARRHLRHVLRRQCNRLSQPTEQRRGRESCRGRCPADSERACRDRRVFVCAPCFPCRVPCPTPAQHVAKSGTSIEHQRCAAGTRDVGVLNMR